MESNLDDERQRFTAIPKSVADVAGGAFAAGFSVAICAGFFLLLAGAAQNNPSRDALWQIVSTMCVPDQTQNHDPRPCAQVELQDGGARGFAILKDLRGETQFLLIPTARISGIESPLVLAPDAANYFADAWEARSYVNDALHKTLPPDDISLAINSAESRSQDQLHIHVDCVRSDVFEALHANEALSATSGPRFRTPFSDTTTWPCGCRASTLAQTTHSSCLAEGVAWRAAGHGRSHARGGRTDAGRRNEGVRSAGRSGE